MNISTATNLIKQVSVVGDSSVTNWEWRRGCGRGVAVTGGAMVSLSPAVRKERERGEIGRGYTMDIKRRASTRQAGVFIEESSHHSISEGLEINSEPLRSKVRKFFTNLKSYFFVFSQLLLLILIHVWILGDCFILWTRMTLTLI